MGAITLLLHSKTYKKNIHMKKMIQIICYVLYKYVATYLPNAKNCHNDLIVQIRTFLVKGYIDSCGKNVNIQRNATIGRRVTIGDFSGVGRNCMVMGGGNNWQACYDGARGIYLYPEPSF